ncbi:hypothetical protein HTS88_20925 [Pseudarthrobacter oxydans]|uniref:hypothetical protein n=1 Tax=Pseudarthrobacter oxydans TaxID=1671 RepID=UPI0015744B94|nr:hypothetical protein [Pseudarthrobacter oxydans]NSX38845.1 hypothetical protein [Pseudarthrobacter oxydans]
MDLRIFRLSRAGGIDTNPTTFTQRAGTFASAVAQSGSATLLTRREATGLHGYVILDGKTVAANAPVSAKSKDEDLRCPVPPKGVVDGDTAEDLGDYRPRPEVDPSALSIPGTREASGQVS